MPIGAAKKFEALSQKDVPPPPTPKPAPSLTNQAFKVGGCCINFKPIVPCFFIVVVVLKQE